MKINSNRKVKNVLDITTGTCFTHENRIYMKISGSALQFTHVFVGTDEETGRSDLCGVNLETGVIHDISNFGNVEIIEPILSF